MKVQLLSGYAGLLGTTQTHIPEGRGLVLFLFSKKSIRSVTKYVMSTWWKWHSPGVSLPWESILSRGLEIGTTWWCGARSPGFGVGPPGLRCQPSHYHLRPVITPPWVSVVPSEKWDNNVWLNIRWVILVCLLLGWPKSLFPFFCTMALGVLSFLRFHSKQFC